MAMEPIRILIADDHAVMRAGLRLLLNGQEDMQVVDEAGDGWQTVGKAVALKPDIVLLDITMPGLSGLEAARQIRQRAPEVKLLVLTMHDDEAYLRQFLQIGAAGYIVKKAADTELVAAIRAVNRGESFIHPSLTRVLIDGYLQQPQPVRAKESAEELTPRETEVLRLVAQGYTSQQIAESLSISVTTVETHRAHIMEKLGLRGRAQLFRYAVSRGLLDPDAP
jgi:two-component system response regulator NreC